MPRNDEAPVWESPYIDRKGQEPLTRFVPLDEAVEVKIHDVCIPKGLQGFVEACHRFPDDVPREDNTSIESILAGRGLWQCLEPITIMMETRGTRVLTHQLVRARIGITYSQLCTGDVDMRHIDFAYPTCWSDEERTAYQLLVLQAKSLYCRGVDVLGRSIQEQRYLMPHGQMSVLWCSVSLATLVGLYSKRCCTMTQAWETYVWANIMRDALLRERPEFAKLFPTEAELASRSWFSKNFDTPHAVTHLWAPDAENDLMEWNPKTFVHGDRSHEQVSSWNPNAEHPIEAFIGHLRVSEVEYLTAKGRAFS